MEVSFRAAGETVGLSWSRGDRLGLLILVLHPNRAPGPPSGQRGLLDPQRHIPEPSPGTTTLPAAHLARCHSWIGSLLPAVLALRAGSAEPR